MTKDSFPVYLAFDCHAVLIFFFGGGGDVAEGDVVFLYPAALCDKQRKTRFFAKISIWMSSRRYKRWRVSGGDRQMQVLWNSVSGKTHV